jgi:hypothetical protein
MVSLYVLTGRARVISTERGPDQSPTKEAKLAAIESKRSSRRTQPARKTSKQRRRLPSLPKPIITRRGKTTIRRYNGRRFHRFEEAQGKPLDYIEFFTAGEYHSIDVRFRIKPPCTLSSSPGSPLKPITLTGRPATGVPSSDGLSSTASPAIPDYTVSSFFLN